MKKLALAALSLGVLFLGFSISLFLLPSGDEGAGSEAAVEPQARIEAPESEPTEADLVAVETPRSADLTAPELPDEGRRAVVAEVSVTRTIGAWGGAKRRQVSGRIELPPGVPEDPTLQIVALSKELEAEDIYGSRGVLGKLERLSAGRADWAKVDRERAEAILAAPAEEALELLPEGADMVVIEDEDEPLVAETIDGMLALAPVAADGTFEVPFPEDATAGWLAVTGRYLFSPEPTRVDLSGSEEPLVAVEVGAWVTGTVAIPADAEDPEQVFEDMRVELEYDPSQFSFFDLQEDWFFERRAILDSEGRFEFRGVDTRPPYRVEVMSEQLANQSSGNLALGDGADKHLEFELVHGAMVRGRITDEDGEPIADAWVRASAGSFFGFAIDTVARGRSDDDGWFELAHVSPGKVQLRARLDGYLDSEAHSLELEDRETRDGITIELGVGNEVGGIVLHADGTPAADIEVEVGFDPDALASMAAFNAARGADGDAVTGPDGRFRIQGLGGGPFLVTTTVMIDGEGFAARKAGVTPGTKDLELHLQPDPTLNGVVVTPDGEPVTEFDVLVEAAGAAFWMGGESIEEHIEDPEGRFSIPGLREGSWTVQAVASGWAVSEALSLELPIEEPVQIVLVPEAVATGFVVDPDGNPIAGATVRRELDMMETIASAAGRIDVTEARTDEEGRFELGGLSAGAVSLVADHPDFVESEPSPAELIAGQRVDDVQLRLRVGGTLTGEVFDEEGKPAGGVMVFMQDTGNFMPVMMQTEADGTFRRESLKPSRWQVSAMLTELDATGFLEGDEEPDMGSFLSGMRMSFAEIKEGEETHVVIGAPPADPVKLTGSVTHAGEPVAKALLTMFPEGAENLGAMKFLTTDGEGKFEAVLDKPGAYLMQVQVKSSSAMEQDNLELPQVVPEGGEHHIDIELPAGRISGRVVGVDGKPAADARVSLGNDDGVAYGSFLGGRYVEARTDDDGNFDIRYLKPGTYSVSAGGTIAGGFFGGQSAEGRQIISGLQVGEGEWLQGVSFRLEKPGEITGQVVDVTGAPVADASVFVRDQNGQLLERFSFITTDSSGSFRYSGVAPGQYTLSARTGDLASIEGPLVAVRAGEASEGRLTMGAGTVLLVTVVDKRGETVKVRLTVHDQHGHQVNGMLSMQEVMNAQGNLYDPTHDRVGPLAAGRYSVTAVSNDGRSVTKPVTLSGQAERKLKLRLK